MNIFIILIFCLSIVIFLTVNNMQVQNKASLSVSLNIENEPGVVRRLNIYLSTVNSNRCFISSSDTMMGTGAGCLYLRLRSYWAHNTCTLGGSDVDFMAAWWK
jgi:hypothetical protein